MDLKKIVDTAETVAQNLGIDNVPGVAQATDMIQGAVQQAKTKADAAGIGGVFDQVENAIEQKVGMDLDGDGDKGVTIK